jgi:hypothetical protein
MRKPIVTMGDAFNRHRAGYGKYFGRLELLRAESYTHYARLSYVITGAMRVLPEALGRCFGHSRGLLHPDSWSPWHLATLSCT